MIQEYIQNQLEEDLESDQISLKEYMDPLRVARESRKKKTAAFSGCL